MKNWQEDLLRIVAVAPSEQEIFDEIIAAARGLGFEYCSYGLRFPFPLSNPKVLTLFEYPRGWAERYDEAGYVNTDPTVLQGRRSRAPLVWSDELFASTPQLWAEAQSFGLRVGWAQSSLDSNGVVGMLTLSRSGEALSASELEANEPQMRWLANVAHLALTEALVSRLREAQEIKLTIVARATLQIVVALQAVEGVIGGIAGDRIVAGGCRQHLRLDVGQRPRGAIGEPDLVHGPAAGGDAVADEVVLDRDLIGRAVDLEDQVVSIADCAHVAGTNAFLEAQHVQLVGIRVGIAVPRVGIVVDGVLTDAVNLSQLQASEFKAANTWITGTVAGYIPPSAAGANSLAAGSGAISSGANSTVIGNGAQAAGQNSVALGDSSNDDARANVVSVGSAASQRQITNVAGGTQDTDAVNVGQLRGFSDALGGGAKIVDGTLLAPTYNINRVEQDGKLSLQIYRNVGDALGGISYSLQNLAEETKNEYANTKYFRANSTAAEAAAIGAESTAMGPQSTAGGASAVAAGDRASAGGAGSVAVGQQSNSSGASAVAIGQNAQATNTGSIALGFNTVSSGLNTIAIGTGAVATNSVAVGAGAQAGGGSAAFGDNAMALNAVRGTALGNAATVTSTGGVALGAGSVASRAGMNGQREAVSNVAVSSTQGAVSVGSPGNERQITNVAGGTEDTDAVNVRQLRAVAVEGSVRYDQNADGTTNYNNVTLGNGQAPNGTRISNVAPGVAGTDAVNMNQLNATNNRIEGVARNAYAGVAAAMATQMPGTYVPGKTVMRVGSAVFKGESAVGISFRRTSENNGWSVTGGVGMSRAGVAATVGAEWVFN